jgi:hypothetical protein
MSGNNELIINEAPPPKNRGLESVAKVNWCIEHPGEWLKWGDGPNPKQPHQTKGALWERQYRSARHDGVKVWTTYVRYIGPVDDE